jgi:putative CocE/NonD family hydrolase
MMIRILLCAALMACLSFPAIAADTPASPDPAKVELHWGQKIPLRDGVHLNATVYLPKDAKEPSPCVFTLTPYVSDTYHDRGMYFAAHGYPFLLVDVRGRGNSEGTFTPFLQEAHDGYDVVEWLAKQPYCNGKVTMWGGSYAGYDQWQTAKEFPPHLATIVPVASPYPGTDYPMTRNIPVSYAMQWLTDVSGHAAQDKMFGDGAFWTAKEIEWFKSGQPFRDLDRIIGNPSPTFQEWLDHPMVDAYWDSFNPGPEQYARINLPILTITGMYDGDQLGAMTHYNLHMKYASAEARDRHYLVIGPWDHAGTRTPTDHLGWYKFGPAALVDLPKLHLDWYAWTMQGGPKPAFLKKRVAYYVTGKDAWRYADTLAGVTAQMRPLHLDSVAGRANDPFASGSMDAKPGRGEPDHYRSDPSDLTNVAIEADPTDNGTLDQQGVLTPGVTELVYHSAGFAEDTEVSGNFRLTAWLAIDQPDTDFHIAVFDVAPDGGSVFLTEDSMRARYRESPREAKLVTERGPLRYEFDQFNFVSRVIAKGHRLRLVISPTNSSGEEQNHNSGGVVADETAKDGRPVTVKVFHDAEHPTTLFVPIGQPEAK